MKYSAGSAMKQRRKTGNFLSIPDGEGGYFFGRELREGMVAFYDAKSAFPLAPDKLADRPILFAVAVMNHAIARGRWRILGHAPLEPRLMAPVDCFMQDAINGKFSIYKEGGVIIPATRAEIEGLERVAAWEPEHVEERLRDHYANWKNRWVEQLKPR